MRRRLVSAAVGVLTVATLASGCKFDGAYDLPLPGHPVDADNGYRVTAEFADILNVVPRSAVKVDDVTVGEVTDVERVGWHAKVTMLIRRNVRLPDNAVADIRQESLLGEKYVALSKPYGRRPVGRLSDGDDIPLSATGRNPEVEEVLGALSMLLSGGGVGQIQVISSELNKVMSGRTDRLRHLLANLDHVVGTLDAQKQDIVTALRSVNHLAATLNAERGTVGAALDTLGPAVRVLSHQHAQLMRMLRQLDRLGQVGSRVIRGTRANLLADLSHLRPILRRFNEAGDALPKGLSLMVSFPFPAEASNVVKGDFANTSIAMDINLNNIFAAYGIPKNPAPGLPKVPRLPLPKVPKIPEAPGPRLPDLPGLTGGASGGTVNRDGGFLGGGLG
jgi:phospholipid/cholesterol/gamma-HCH transport system substrate-binding protein